MNKITLSGWCLISSTIVMSLAVTFWFPAWVENHYKFKVQAEMIKSAEAIKVNSMQAARNVFGCSPTGSIAQYEEQ